MKEVKKIRQIRSELNAYFLERHDEIDCMLTALLSKQHCLFLGPPGTAKSQMCRALASHIEGANYFERLLMKFTPPEDILGPLDLLKLQQGIYERITAGKLPEAHIAFLDEIFKASSAILNAILTIINERIFHNNSKPQEVPLISLFSASNELPEEEEGLKALYDRLAIRKVTNYISDYQNLHTLILLSNQYVPKTTITLDELMEMHESVEAVDIKPIVNDMLKIKYSLNKEGIVISDRRLKQSSDIIKAFAFLNGRDEAILDDLTVLQHVFWTEPEEIPTVKSKILEIADPYAKKAMELEAILSDLEEQCKKYTELTQDTIEIYNKVHEIIVKLSDLIDEARKSKKNTENLERIKRRAENLKQHMATNILKIS